MTVDEISTADCKSSKSNFIFYLCYSVFFLLFMTNANHITAKLRIAFDKSNNIIILNYEIYAQFNIN